MPTYKIFIKPGPPFSTCNSKHHFLDWDLKINISVKNSIFFISHIIYSILHCSAMYIDLEVRRTVTPLSRTCVCAHTYTHFS